MKTTQIFGCIVVLLLSFCVGNAEAILIPFTSENEYAIEWDFDHAWRNNPNNGGGFIGGPSANNVWGLAELISFDQAYDIDYLEFDVYVSNFPKITSHFEWNFYTGSTTDFLTKIIPDSTTQVVNSPYSTPSDGGAPVLYQNWRVPFNTGVYSGQKYWLSVERGAGDSLDRTQVSNVKLGGNVVPEPSTMILFGSGILGAIIRKRKKSLAPINT